MKKIILALVLSAMFSASACDALKGVVAPVVVFVSPETEVDVPFDYRDCASPAQVSFTITGKSVKNFSARVSDLTTGIEYTTPIHAPISNVISFSNIPAAGHLLWVRILNGARGNKQTVTISVR
jgi:hypothetical protein